MGSLTGDDERTLVAVVERWAVAQATDGVVRSAVSEPCQVSQAMLSEQGRLGWLTLDEDASMAALSRVVEILGRWLIPGAFLPTATTRAVVRRWGSPALQDEWLPALASGASPAGMTLTAGSVRARPTKAGMVLEGVGRAVVGGAVPEVVLVAAHASDRVEWFVVPAADVGLKEVDAFDPTRSLFELRFDHLVVPHGQRLGAPPGVVEALVATLLAAECVGGSQRCLELATEHARSRHQFGGPIGRFQAVKHRCADMLVAVEEARASAWDAAVAADSEGNGILLSAAVAAAIAPQSFARCARDLVQLLGATGFAWEHDAHLYLRRATVTQQLLGPPPQWCRRVAEQVLGGRRRELRVTLPADAEADRERIRLLVDEVAQRPEGERLRRLLDLGLLASHLRPPWGRGASTAEQLVIDQELASAGVRVPALLVGTWVVETLAAHGSAEQQARWLPGTLMGETLWCQLFSEPGAGSDLSAIRTAATRASDGWILDGHKTWISLAAEAQLGLCLARTEVATSGHGGLTVFVVDMNAEGIAVHPIREMTGGSLLNDVYFSEVALPADAAIGAVGAGWEVARTTLASERVAMGDLSSYGRTLEGLLGLLSARSTTDHDRVRVGALVAEMHALRLLGVRATLKALRGEDKGTEASVRKLASAELDQRILELAVELLAEAAATVDGEAAQWLDGYLFSRAMTIAGGTSEIQRNIIGERLLGLPKDVLT